MRIARMMKHEVRKSRIEMVRVPRQAIPMQRGEVKKRMIVGRGI